MSWSDMSQAGEGVLGPDSVSLRSHHKDLDFLLRTTRDHGRDIHKGLTWPDLYFRKSLRA